MCKNCKASPLGIERQSELDAAIAECQRLNVNPSTSGFIARHSWRGYTPQFTDEQRAALTRYNTAQSLMKALHEDYVFDLARKAAQQRLDRINANKRDPLLEYAVAFDANDDAAQAAILCNIPAESGLDAAIAMLHARMDGERTACEYVRAMRREDER